MPRILGNIKSILSPDEGAKPGALQLHTAGFQGFDLAKSLLPPSLNSLHPEPDAQRDHFRKMHKGWSAASHSLRVSPNRSRTLDIIPTKEGEA